MNLKNIKSVLESVTGRVFSKHSPDDREYQFQFRQIMGEASWSEYVSYSNDYIKMFLENGTMSIDSYFGDNLDCNNCANRSECCDEESDYHNKKSETIVDCSEAWADSMMHQNKYRVLHDKIEDQLKAYKSLLRNALTNWNQNDDPEYHTMITVYSNLIKNLQDILA